MKKTLFLIILTALAAFSYADELLNRSVFIEGDAARQEQFEFFYTNFKKEAVGIGAILAGAREHAGFIFKFDVSDNPLVHEDGNKFLLTIKMINNANNLEVLYFGFYFNTLEEMYEHNQYLFYRAVSVIPPITEQAVIYAQTAWKYKWLYARASFDYPISFYELMPKGLYGGIAVYKGSFNSPDSVSDIDHKIITLPGFTIGAEFHFLDFMSFELNLRGFFGDFNKNEFLNLAAGAQIKFPLKFVNFFVISPYIAGSYQFLYSKEVFYDHPAFSLGGGIQLNVKGGTNGSFFIDINYMAVFNNALRYNPYDGNLFPNPPIINYKPFFIGLGAGYKYGFFNRQRKQPDPLSYYDSASSPSALPQEGPRAPAETAPKEPAAPRERAQNEWIFYF